jgi:hypothetical protein
VQEPDRKVLWALVFTLGVTAAIIAWIAFIGPANNGSESAGQQEQEHLFLYLSPEAWTAIFTAVLTASTIGLWLQTKRLAEGAEGQAADTRTSLAIAREAADAAVAAQRPWLDISVEVLSDLKFSDSGPEVTLGFTIHNLGNTPATCVQFWPCMLPENPVGHANCLELGFEKVEPFSQKVAEIEFGLTAFPGNSGPQEQTHTVEDVYLTAIVPDWPARPKIGLCVAIVMTYRFIGGTGRTKCGYKIVPVDAAARKNDSFNPIHTYHRDILMCRREPLWDEAS